MALRQRSLGCSWYLWASFMPRGESYETTRGNRFRIIAKAGVVPFLITLACAWSCLEWLLGVQWAYAGSVWLFKLGIATTAIYGTVTLLFYL